VAGIARVADRPRELQHQVGTPVEIGNAPGQSFRGGEPPGPSGDLGDAGLAGIVARCIELRWLRTFDPLDARDRGHGHRPVFGPYDGRRGGARGRGPARRHRGIRNGSRRPSDSALTGKPGDLACLGEEFVGEARVPVVGGGNSDTEQGAELGSEISHAHRDGRCHPVVSRLARGVRQVQQDLIVLRAGGNAVRTVDLPGQIAGPARTSGGGARQQVNGNRPRQVRRHVGRPACQVEQVARASRLVIECTGKGAKHGGAHDGLRHDRLLLGLVQQLPGQVRVS
jgi:hypothetical protein